MTPKASRISHVEREYGVGLMALETKPDKIYKNRKEAINAAFNCGVYFIVEYVGNSKKILAWNAYMRKREDLLERFKGCGDKLAQLNSCEEPMWLELGTRSEYNHIMPLSQVESFERLDPNKIL